MSVRVLGMRLLMSSLVPRPISFVQAQRRPCMGTRLANVQSLQCETSFKLWLLYVVPHKVNLFSHYSGMEGGQRLIMVAEFEH